MKRTQQLFLLASVMVPLHIVEQLLFGIDELYELQTMLSTAVNRFDDPDRATVVLVGLVVTMVLFFGYGFMAGGVPRLIAVAFFGLEFRVESHHIVKTIARGAYLPGAVTAAALAGIGALILASGWREFHATRTRETEDPRLTFAGA